MTDFVIYSKQTNIWAFHLHQHRLDVSMNTVAVKWILHTLKETNTQAQAKWKITCTIWWSR